MVRKATIGPLWIGKNDDGHNVTALPIVHLDVSSRWHVATRIFGQLCRALAEHGEITIKVVDLAGRDGLTDYRNNVIYLDHRLTLAGARAALCHELTHLRRGPSGGCASIEEHHVRRETARILAPHMTALSRLGRPWTHAELAAFAQLGEGGGDHATVHDAATLTRDIPAQRVAIA